MKYLSLIWMSVWRRRVRTTFTLLCVFIAFMLFGLVMTIRNAFTLGVSVAGIDRLVLINKITLVMPLPVSYRARLQQVEGVDLATHQTWFNGAYQQPTNVLSTIAVEPAEHLKIYKEYKLPQEQIDSWLKDRQGVMVGKDLAERYGWKIGDRIPLISAIWESKDPWEFNIDAIYDAEAGVDKTQFFLRYDYLDQNRVARQRDFVGWYVVKIHNADQAIELSRRFDEMFANSGSETKTTTEKGFVESFAKQIGDIGSITIAIASTVLFMFGMVAASTMVQSVRERTSELAVLKTLGFGDGLILTLVLAESLFITVLAGGLGLLAAWAVVQRGDPTGGLLPIFILPSSTLVVGVALMILMGLVAGVAPAVAAMRLRIVDALRRT
jgi:putative ABC transport system permease protein